VVTRLALLALCAGCAHPPAAHPTTPARPPAESDKIPIPPDGLAADFDFLVDALRASYAHLDEKRAQFGVDLDALAARYRPRVRDGTTWSEHERLMAAFAGEFHDAHLAWRRARARGERRRRIVRLGLETRLVDGELVVASVWPGSGAERAGVRPGDRVRAVDGEPIAARRAGLAKLRSWSREEDAGYDFAEEWPARRIDEGEAPPAIALNLADEAGAERTIRVTPETEKPEALRKPKAALESRDGAAWLTLRTLSIKPEELARTLDELLAPARAAKQPLIVDLRGNEGGWDAGARVASERLIEGEVVGGAVRIRLSPGARALRAEWRTLPEDPERPGWSRALPVAAHGPSRWPAPIALLVDAGCRSSCESLALILRAAGARLFGERTGGSSGAPISIALPRTAARVTIPAWSMVDGAGHPIEGQGIAPDEEVRWTRADVQSGHDPVAARALAWILAR
jgi:carboxyl-terminal processing protease